MGSIAELALDEKGRIKFSDIMYYFNFSTLKLTAEEEKSLLAKFKLVRNSPIHIDTFVSLVFYGKANLQTFSSIHQSVTTQIFLRQLRDEMNLFKKGSFHIFK